MRRLLIVSTVLAALATPVHAGPAGDTLRDALYAGSLAEGLATLAPLAAAGDTEAAFGVGALRLATTLEGLVQTLWRHGFDLPRRGPFLDGLVPPVPQNPAPEPFDYQGVRAMLQALVDGLDDARTAFVAAGAGGDYVIELDLLRLSIDANGDGTVEAGESLAGVMALLMGGEVADWLAPPRPGEPAQLTTVGFDRADAFWFAGYTQILAAQADFLLAHDFSDFTDAVFHRFFPRAGFPLEAYATGGALLMDPDTDTAIADLVAAIHTISWPVTDAARLAGVRTRLAAVLGFSRQNWQAILAETDDRRELVPSPKQTPIIPGMSVDEARVAAWLVTLDEAAKVLDGALLVPHWRFKQGVDLKAYFETATRTDLVMLLTGMGALPFLADGPVASPADFRAMQDAFGSDWLGYAFWFN
jgi:hypothetical protein